MNLQPVRGTKDLLGTDAVTYNYIINKVVHIFERYGYEPIFTPIIEFTEVFKRTLGDYSDVVSKEMYNFVDRGGENITLRPEFTASIARAYISNNLSHQIPLRYYSYGPLFRYERPQKGRYRQFHQLNIECLGIRSPQIDGEIIEMATHFLQELQIYDQVELHLNSLGCVESRKSYTEAIINYFQKYQDSLSPESKLRLTKNPLRIFDSKDSKDKEICSNAPTIDKFYTDETKEFFESVIHYLEINNIKYRINHHLVRGLDYYAHTAFEFITDNLGAQGTVLGGGRYNNLIKTLGGVDTPGVGFGSGIERLMLLINQNLVKKHRVNVIIPIGDDKIMEYAIKIASILRKSGITIIQDYDYNSAKKIKRANKINAKLAIFIGEEELSKNIIKVKDLDSGSQQDINLDNMIEYIKNTLSYEL